MNHSISSPVYRELHGITEEEETRIDELMLMVTTETRRGIAPGDLGAKLREHIGGINVATRIHKEVQQDTLRVQTRPVCESRVIFCEEDADQE